MYINYKNRAVSYFIVKIKHSDRSKFREKGFIQLTVLDYNP